MSKSARYLSVLVVVVVSVLAVACKRTIHPEQVAAKAAQTYYEELLHGHYDQFVDGHYQSDSIPGSYREQLIANAKMFVGQQNEDRRGIKQVRVVNAAVDTLHHVGTVYLVFAYGDSTTDEVAVPMIYRKGVWYMK
jgi:hypothetical protein